MSINRPVGESLKHFLLEFMNCRGVFLHTLPLAQQVLNATGENVKEVAQKWKNQTLLLLQNYVMIPNPRAARLLFILLCSGCTGEDVADVKLAYEKAQKLI